MTKAEIMALPILSQLKIVYEDGENFVATSGVKLEHPKDVMYSMWYAPLGKVIRPIFHWCDLPSTIAVLAHELEHGVPSDQCMVEWDHPLGTISASATDNVYGQIDRIITANKDWRGHSGTPRNGFWVFARYRNHFLWACTNPAAKI